jgi:chromosome partitioning protein
MSMAKIVAITNQKGGVGKTTTAINISASLAATKRRVLLVDLDPQGNATQGCGVDRRNLEASGYEVLMGETDIRQVLRPAAGEAGFMLLPGNADLTAAEVSLINAPEREARLKPALAEIADEFDYIFIDCPPSLNMLTINALTAADTVLIPMQCEYYALEGLSALLETIERIRRQVNPRLEVEGLLRTMLDTRNNLASEVSGQLMEHFGDKVYRTAIPRNVRLAEAPSYGLPVLHHDKSSRGALAYLALAGEMLRRDEQKRPQLTTTP